MLVLKMIKLLLNNNAKVQLSNNKIKEINNNSSCTPSLYKKNNIESIIRSSRYNLIPKISIIGSLIFDENKLSKFIKLKFEELLYLDDFSSYSES